MVWRVCVVAVVLAMGISSVSAQGRLHRLHLAINPGLDFASLRGRDTNGTSVLFPNGNNFRLGLSIEVNSRSPRWMFLFEPAYQQYSCIVPYPLKYNSIETSGGIRRSFFLNGYNGFFLQALGVVDIPINFELQLAPQTVFPSNSFRANVAAGAGVLLGRFALEYRQHSKRNIRDDFGSFSFGYNKRSIIASFRIF